MSTSSIEWTDETWNPTTGCDRVSPGCDNCYALTMSARLKAMGQAKYQTDGRPETSGPGFGVQTHPDTLDQPLRWRKPRRVFVNSMSDLFHPQVPDSFIADVFDVMGAASLHSFQVLTKRPQRMRSDVTAYYESRGLQPYPNVWLGTSVEDQERANQRIPYLLATPAAVRFLSCEPLLGPVNISAFVEEHWEGAPRPEGIRRGPRVGWVIVGGESGLGARPMDVGWADDIAFQCQQAGVPVFVKQLGSRPYYGATGEQVTVTGKGGDPGEWPEALRVREFPEAVPA